MALSRKYHKPLSAIAKANNIEPHTMVKVGDRIVIPGVRAPQAALKPAATVAAASRSLPPRRRSPASCRPRPQPTPSAAW